MGNRRPLDDDAQQKAEGRSASRGAAHFRLLPAVLRPASSSPFTPDRRPQRRPRHWTLLPSSFCLQAWTDTRSSSSRASTWLTVDPSRGASFSSATTSSRGMRTSRSVSRSSSAMAAARSAPFLVSGFPSLFTLHSSTFKLPPRPPLRACLVFLHSSPFTLHPSQNVPPVHAEEVRGAGDAVGGTRLEEETADVGGSGEHGRLLCVSM